MFKFYILGLFVAVLILAGIARTIELFDKKVITPIANRLARREWNTHVMRQMQHSQKEFWKYETFSVAKNFRGV